MKLIIQIVRFFVGGLFIFSGLVKINDPIGTAIKMEEYFEVFSSDFGSIFELFIPIALPIGMILIILEIALGVALLINYQLKVVLWSLAAIIVFFTFLTFYSAYFNKVTDCGCFGDAIPLNPWQSFFKDVILVVCIALLLYKQNLLGKPTLPALAGHIVVASATLLSLFIGIYAIRNLPYIDFRAYKIGTHIPSAMEPSAPLKYSYIMEKDGKKETFDQYPTGDEYTFVEMKLQNPEDQPKISDYGIYNDDGDFTELSFRGNKVLIIIPRAHEASDKGMKKVSRLVRQINDIPEIELMIITATAGDSFEKFRHEYQLAADYFYGDDTVLKTMIRSNPGIVLLQDGSVLGKWHHNNSPAAEEIKSLLK
ncbi:MAG: DoxX family protein [Cyclobacteriaceae bacterium]|nr:DoxX family protein [Cyclobacteriaceae bacterium]MCH8516734.1 DoxX family protein [Cyclobacteriaceae bacterium]